MNKIQNVSSLLFMLVCLQASAQDTKSYKQQSPFIQVPADIIIDKIRGGMLGQMIGNLNGLPHEMRYIESTGHVKNYIPSLPNGAWTDDDTDFEWVYITMMEKYRTPYLPIDTIYSLWKQRINKKIWCANRYARFLMDLGIKPPYTGNQVFNPWADFNISGQFLCETYGLIAPAMPQTAAKIGLHYTTVAILGEPAQTTQLFTSMISEAFIENDINKIIASGLSAIDSSSRVYGVVKNILKWHALYQQNWTKTRQLIKDTYTQENSGIRDRNGYEINTSCVLSALLYGEGDFSETLKMAFNFGWDADCNAATAGTILGVLKGYKWIMAQGWDIKDRYHNTTRDYMPDDETITSFSDRLINLFTQINKENGGEEKIINDVRVFKIPVEQPSPVLALKTTNDYKIDFQKKLQPQIAGALQNGSQQEKAKAVYLAVCLDLAPALQSKYPQQWKEACYDLSGYWKVMSNLMRGQYEYDQFLALDKLKEQFRTAGFKVPAKKYTDEDVYEDTVVWKDPEQVY